MTELLKPEGRDQIFADLDRRLSILEVTARVGLNRVRFAHSTGSTHEPTVYDAYESGGTSNTWRDDTGATGPGYPEVTLVTGRKVLFIMNALIHNIGHGGSFRCDGMYLGIGIDGSAPPVWTDPRMYRQIYSQFSDHLRFPGAFAVVRTDLVPGEHQFGLWAWWIDDAPAGTTLPKLYEASLTVIPLDI